MSGSIIYFAAGLLLAALTAAVMVPLVNRRTVRLSTQRLEIGVEQLETAGASQAAELRRRDEIIKRHEIEVAQFRDRWRTADEQRTLNAEAMHQAERVLSDKELELARVMEQLDERSTLANVQKVEISTLQIELEALKETLEETRSNLAALERCRNAERIEVEAATRKLVQERDEAECALSAKELELGQLMLELVERSSWADAQKGRSLALKAEIEALKQAFDESRNELKRVEDGREAQRIELHESIAKLTDDRRETEHALSDKESELVRAKRELAEQLALGDTRTTQISALEAEIEALTRMLDESRHALKAGEDRCDAERSEFGAAIAKVMEDCRQTEHALCDKEAELAEARGELEERSVLANIEIDGLKAQVEALKQGFSAASAELKEIDDRRVTERTKLEAAYHEAHRARCEKELELTTLERELEEHSVLADAQKMEIGNLNSKVEALEKALSNATAELKTIENGREAEGFAIEAAAREAQRTLSEKESDLGNLQRELQEQSALAGAQKLEIAALRSQVEALKKALEGASAELKAIEGRRDPRSMKLETAVRNAEQALSKKQSELAILKGELDERSALADAQKMETGVLKNQVETLNKLLDQERAELEDFRNHVAELVQQLVAQTAEDKLRAQDLENHVADQSRLLEERAIELSHLRSEIEIASKAEADLRSTAIEIEARANIEIQNLKAESAKLQAALDRANCERMRLAHELAKLKRQPGEPWAA
jgi:chromosome segregation ATPase